MTSATAPTPWDRYWAYGNLHSFSQVQSGNYGGAVGEFWRGRFADLGPNARVLDIATGNGAVALLALEAGDEADQALAVTGTDLAAIDPARGLDDPTLRAQAQRVRFHGRTPAERLPFESASMDHVCSQFGIEYSDLAQSIPEATRVLAPAGTIDFILHHHQSQIVRAALAEAEQLAFVLDEVQLYLKARNLLRAMAQTPPGRKGGRTNAKTQKRQQALDQAITRIQEAALGATDASMLRGPLNYIQEILAMIGQRRPAELLRWLEEARQRVVALRTRLAEMQRAALDAEGMGRLIERLEAHGCERVSTAPLCEADDGIVAWQLTARRL
jgi:ubiquinone/menaquinone biosynthesis C-methylase UbiE